MIYFFRAICSESEDFVIDIAIDSKAKFSDLNSFIQKRLDFDASQITSFFITDDEWHKEQEITQIDMMDGEGGVLVMDKIRLGDLITDLKQRMLYVFDMLSERLLFMELNHIDEGTLQQPVCTRQQGNPPPQFSESAFDIEEVMLGDDLGDIFTDDDIDMGEFPDEGIDPDDLF